MTGEPSVENLRCKWVQRKEGCLTLEKLRFYLFLMIETTTCSHANRYGSVTRRKSMIKERI